MKGKNFWVTRGDLLRAREWDALGFAMALKTPDNTLVFVTPQEAALIRKDQSDCMGCLSQCQFGGHFGFGTRFRTSDGLGIPLDHLRSRKNPGEQTR